MKKFFLCGITILMFFLMTSCKTSPNSKPENTQSQPDNQIDLSDSEKEIESGIDMDNKDNGRESKSKSESKTESETTNQSQFLSMHSPSTKIDQNHLDLILSRINNTLPYDKLITKQIDIDLFIEKCDKDPTDAIFTKLTLITDVDTEFGIECLRKTENDSLYSVHKIKQGGLLYVFYRDRMKTGEYNEIKNWYYVKKALKYQDFSSIVNGTDISKVADIDPVTNIYIERANKFDKSFGTATYHYLEDGILLIYYKYVNGKFEVGWQDYQKDFQIMLFHKEERVEIYNGRVLEMDFLK